MSPSLWGSYKDQGHRACKALGSGSGPSVGWILLGGGGGRGDGGGDDGVFVDVDGGDGGEAGDGDGDGDGSDGGDDSGHSGVGIISGGT